MVCWGGEALWRNYMKGADILKKTQSIMYQFLKPS